MAVEHGPDRKTVFLYEKAMFIHFPLGWVSRLFWMFPFPGRVRVFGVFAKEHRSGDTGFRGDSSWGFFMRGFSWGT